MFVLAKEMIGLDEGLRVIIVAFCKVILEFFQELAVSTTVALMKKHSGVDRVRMQSCVHQASAHR
jgi:hypothetical protein